VRKLAIGGRRIMFAFTVVDSRALGDGPGVRLRVSGDNPHWSAYHNGIAVRTELLTPKRTNEASDFAVNRSRLSSVAVLSEKRTDCSLGSRMRRLLALLFFGLPLLAQTTVPPGDPNLQPALTDSNGQGAVMGNNFSGLRFTDNNKFSSIANIQSDCGLDACPFFITPLFANTTPFTPLPANDFLMDVRRPAGKYGPMLIVGDLPPSIGSPPGYPLQQTGCPGGPCDTGLDLQYTNFAASRQFNLTGTTINTNYSLDWRFYVLSGNPRAGVGDKQIVGFYNAIEKSRGYVDLANVDDLKVGNNYISVRAPGFTGNVDGIEDDCLYRAAGTIVAINSCHFLAFGIPDAIAANIKSTSYGFPIQFNANQTGAVSNVTMVDLRPILSMGVGGTLGGLTGYCFACVQTVTTRGAVTQNIYGFQRQGPNTLPAFAADKYWFASINNPGRRTGANVNNDYWSGGDWNTGHLTFGGDGGVSGTHLWFSAANTFRFKIGSAPTRTDDGLPINAVLPASLVTSPGTSDDLAITGMTASGHCTLTATNAAAAANIASTYISHKTSNQITVAHAEVANMNYDILCTPD